MDELDAVLLELVEAVKRGASKAKAERMVRPLELAMRKGFRSQSVLFVKKLRAKKAAFTEATPIPAFPHPSTTLENAPLRIGEGAHDPWQRWAETLNQPIQEGLSPEDWLMAWYEVEQATVKLFAEPVDKAVAKALEIGALTQIGELGMDIRWTVKNPKALAYLNDYGAKMVKGINETTREYLNTLLTQAANEGWSYQRTAQAIIVRFEEFAMGQGQGHIDSRAHLIAVTEIGNAYTEGNLIIARDLAAAGLPMEKYWDTVGDDKVSQGCLDNEAAGWISVDDTFPSGDMRPLRFPGCRCDLLTRLKKE